MLRFTATLAALLLGATLGLACGDGNDGDDQASMCESVGGTICTEACACGDCSIVMSDGTTTVSFDDEAGCRALYVDLGCSDPDDSIDFAACSSDLASPECVDSADGSNLSLPASCESMN